MNNSQDKNRGGNARGRENDQMGAQDELDTTQQPTGSSRDAEEDSNTMGGRDAS